MTINDFDMEKAPQSGYLLAYTKKSVLLKQYDEMDSGKKAGAILAGQEVLEAHFFDDKKEFRVLEAKSRRYSTEETPGKVEAVAELTELPKEELFKEEILLEESFAESAGIQTILVLNQVSYDDNGMASIVNYQLVPGRKREV